jgi:hypothetical protein
MKYAAKMPSGAMTYIRCFIEIVSDIKKWITDTQAARVFS